MNNFLSTGYFGLIEQQNYLSQLNSFQLINSDPDLMQ